MAEHRVWFRICQPCADVRHEDCTGGTDTDFCECLAEVFMEAEERTDEA